MKHVVVFYLMNQCKVTYFEPMHKIWFPKCLSQGHTSCESNAYFLSKIILGVVSSKLLFWMDNSWLFQSCPSRLFWIRHWHQNHWPSFLQRQKSTSPLGYAIFIIRDYKHLCPSTQRKALRWVECYPIFISFAINISKANLD